MMAYVVIVTGLLTGAPELVKLGPMPTDQAQLTARMERWRNRPGVAVRVEEVPPEG